MIYWFSTKNLKYNRFFNDEFICIDNPTVLKTAQFLYFTIIGLYVIHVMKSIITKKINLPKHLLIIGTIVSWYLSIVYYNNDLIFTLFNVITHGIPYMALVYFTEIKSKNTNFKFLGNLNTKNSWKYHILVLLIIAFIEELIWEITHWQENFEFTNEFLVNQKYLWFWIPLLALPQLTHYILDGFIWKNKKKI